MKVSCNQCRAKLDHTKLNVHLKVCVGWQRFGYMCGIDYGSELDSVPGGTKIYPTVANLKTNKNCCRKGGGCEIVKVKIVPVKIWAKEI